MIGEIVPDKLTRDLTAEVVGLVSDHLAEANVLPTTVLATYIAVSAGLLAHIGGPAMAEKVLVNAMAGLQPQAGRG